MIAAQVVDREVEVEPVRRAYVFGGKNSGRVQDGIETVVFREDALCSLADTGMSRKVDGEKRSPLACFAEGHKRLLAFALISPKDDDAVALGQELPRCLEANTAVATAYK